MNQIKLDREKIVWISILLLLTFLFCIGLFDGKSGGNFISAPAVIIDTVKMEDLGSRETELAVSVTGLGKDIYPAASFSFSFDPSKLEFLGIEEGNIVISNPNNISGVDLPKWEVNVQRSNETGIINIMYLDMTAGKCAFSRNLLSGKDDILVRLNFRLRGSVREKDTIDILIEDAVFAAVDENKSLASSKGTLKTKNGKIVIGGK